MRLSVIMAAHNEGQALAKTVASCVETCAGLDYEILVADDASWDGSVEEVERRFSRVRVLKNLERQGPSPTKDRGARAAAGEVLVFLDGHTKPERGALARLADDVDFLDGRAIVAPTIVPLDVGRWRSAALPKGHGYRVDLEHHRSTWLSLDKLRVVDRGPRKFYESPVAIGCALAVSRELYDTLWGFDRDMRFWGVEDVDFSLKCWLMGYSVLHDPEPVIGHRFQRSFSNYSVPASHLLANQLRLARKNFTQTTFEEWVERRRKEHGEDLEDHPEGLWTHTWQLFETRRASAEEERAFLLSRRTRDEFWYAKRSGLPWPRLGTAAVPDLAAKLAADERPAAVAVRGPMPSPSPSPTPGHRCKPDPTTGCHCVCDCPTCDSNGTTAPYAAPQTGAPSITPHIKGNSGNPVHYGNGEVQLAVTDLSVSGFGLNFGHTRIFSNRLNGDFDFGNGYNWLVRDLPQLVEEDSNTVLMLQGTRGAMWFDLIGGQYVGRYGTKFTLTQNEGAGVFTLAAPNGETLVFNDFNVANAGLFQSRTTAGGQALQVTAYAPGTALGIGEVQRSYTTGGVTTIESFLYNHAGDDLAGVLLRRKIGAGAWQNVRQVLYAYYGDDDPNGSFGDLKTATVQTWNAGAWQTIDNNYYRYWTFDGGGGLWHGLKYLLGGAAYDRMAAAGLDPLTASDAQLAGYADNYFEYDVERHVRREATNGGLYVTTFSRATNTNPDYTDGYNNWQTKVVEGRADGSTNTVYCNYVNDPILAVFAQGADQWITAVQFNERGDPLQYAHPSAVVGFDESKNDLGIVYRPNAGLIEKMAYYGAAAPGYLKTHSLQQGANGTPVVQMELSYTSVTAGGVTIYPQARSRQYRDDAGTQPLDTNFGYVFYPGTTAVQQRTTTWPIVPASQNGSGLAESRVEKFDQLGNQVSLINERGVVTNVTVDVITGAQLQRVDDATGMALVTDFEVDNLGRTTQSLGPLHTIDLAGVATPVRTATWRVYQDAINQIWTAQGYAIPEDGPPGPSSQKGNGLGRPSSGNAPNIVGRRVGTAHPLPLPPGEGRGEGVLNTAGYNFVLINPVSITTTDADNNLTDQIQAVRASTAGPLSPTDSFPQSAWTRWTHSLYNDNNQFTAARVYFAIPANGEGVKGVNYNETLHGYDALGRANRLVTGGGTITRTVLDPRGLPLSVWIGTNDTGATDTDPTGGGAAGNNAAGNNMVAVQTSIYDAGASGGDGNTTLQTLPVDSNPASDRKTAFAYDWRNRQIRVTAAQDWYQVNTLDNLNHAILAQQHSQATNTLIRQSATNYDNRGRAYQSLVYGVDANTGAVGNVLTDNTWFDPSSNVLMTLPAGSQAFTKSVYDAISRQTAQYVGYYSGGVILPLLPGEGRGEGGLRRGEGASPAYYLPTYAQALDISGATIVEQTETLWDAASNAIQTTTRQRFHNAAGLGPLTQPGGAQPQARVTYAMVYPDGIGRAQAVADYGTNGDVPLVRPDTIPTSLNSVHVSLTLYNDRGEPYQSIDAMGTIDQTTLDDAGRRVQLIRNYQSGQPSTGDVNVTVEWTYTADNQTATMTAINAATGDQTTSFIFGTTLGTSDVARNDVLAATVYADGGTVEYLVNRQSERKQLADQNGTVHAYGHDLVARPTTDSITTLGAGVDGSVLCIGRTYDVLGNLEHVTSFSDAAGTNVVNDILRVYNSFEQCVNEYQEHNGAVNVSMSVAVGYQYADGSANTIRQTGLVYPNGRVISLDYGTAGGIDDALSRVQSLIDDDGTNLVNYTRIGLGTFVQQVSAQPQIAWSLINGSGIDPYTGLDQFNQIADNRWYSTATSADLDRIQHGYDLAGNRLYRKNTVAEAAGVHLDELYSYDGLYRLARLDRGQLNAANNGIVAGTESFTEAWTLDAVGNWLAFNQADTGGSWTLEQTRTANLVNEITGIAGGGWTKAKYDAAGNTIEFPQSSAPAEADAAAYDAWNRIVSVSRSGAVIERSAYDGENRRVTSLVLDMSRQFYFSAGWRDLEERLATSTVADRQFVWGLRHVDDILLRDYLENDPSRLYALQDANRNVTGIVGSAGIVLERYVYHAYGIPVFMNGVFSALEDSAFGWETLFSGYRFDRALALFRARNRVLTSVLGRWLTRDPFAVRQIAGGSLYAYVSSRPVSAVDPWGLFDVSPGRILQSFCSTINGPLLSGDVVTCACGIAGAADLFTSNPIVEGADCACNVLTSLQLACKGQLTAAAVYSALTISDCGSWAFAAMGCGFGALVGGLVGGLFGPAGGIAGSMIGCFVGHRSADSFVDAVSYGMQNVVVNLSQSGNLSVLPNAAAAACCRLAPAPAPKPRPKPRQRGGGRSPSPRDVCTIMCAQTVKASSQEEWNVLFEECVDDCLAEIPLPWR